MARHQGVVLRSSKVIFVVALALWWLFSVASGPRAQVYDPVYGVDATFITVSGRGNEQAYIGGDGRACCGHNVPDVQLGSLNPEVRWISLYNAPGWFGMSLSAQDGLFWGYLDVRGVKRFIQDHPNDPTQQIAYVSLEGPEAGTYIRGTAELVNGEAIVTLPEHFSMVTSEEGLTVQLTPVGEWLHLYVLEKSTTKLVIREAQGKSGKFDYLVQGVRKGYENYQPVEEKPPLPRSATLHQNLHKTQEVIQEKSR